MANTTPVAADPVQAAANQTTQIVPSTPDTTVNSASTSSSDPASKSDLLSPSNLSADGQGGELNVSGAVDLENLLADNPTQYDTNILNNYVNPSYLFTLFMTGDTELNGTGVPSGQRIIIAQSGVTAGYNIKQVTMSSLVAGNEQTRGIFTTDFQITIVEALGTSLLENLTNAAASLNIKNTVGLPCYFLTLSFTGYDTDGNLINNITDEVKTYQLHIKTIDVTFENGTSTYVLEAMCSEHEAVTEEFLRIPESLTATGNTISDMLSSLATKLTQVWADRYKDTIYTFDFKTHLINGTGLTSGDDPGSYTLVPNDPNLNSARSLSMVNGQPVMQAKQGEGLNDLIDYLFANSPQSQQSSKNVPTQNNVNVSSSESTSTGVRNSVYFRIEPSVSITGYDTKTQLYRKTITYHVIGYTTNKPILSVEQYKDAQKQTTQQTIISKLRNAGFLQRRYDYVYTGLNTEVLRFDMKLNMNWAAIIPNLEGFRATSESVVTHALYNEKQQAQLNKPSVTTSVDPSDSLGITGVIDNSGITSSLSSLGSVSQIASAVPLSSNTINLLSPTNLDLSQSWIDGPSLLTQSSDSPLISPNTIRQGLLAVGSTQLGEQSSGSVNQYAEDFSSDSAVSLPPIALKQSVVESQANTGGVLKSPYHRDRSLYGAILDQAYMSSVGSQSASLLANITLDIRGDPFWLGYDNLTRQQQLVSDNLPDQSKNTKVPNFGEGENHFLFVMGFPYGVGADGLPLIRRSTGDRITGMYLVNHVDSVFSDGQFTQTLTAIRQGLIDAATALNYSSITGVADATQPTADGSDLGGSGPTQTPYINTPASIQPAIQAGAQATGAKYSLLQKLAQAESSNNPNASSGTGATGLFQITHTTYNSVASTSAAQQAASAAGVNLANGPTDPGASSVVAGVYVNQLQQQIQANGQQVNDTNTYVYYSMGASGGNKFLNAYASDPSATFGSLGIGNPLGSSHNNLTLSQVYSNLSNKMGGT